MWNVPFLAVKTATGERFMNEKIDTGRGVQLPHF